MVCALQTAMLTWHALCQCGPDKRRLTALDHQQIGQHFGFALFALAVVQCVLVIGLFVNRAV
jgi:hypothetical protein